MDPHERAWCLARARDARRQATRFSRGIKHSAPGQRLTLVPRVDIRGIDYRSRQVDCRPRERREQRHTARSTSSGDSGDPESEPPRRGGELRHVGEIIAETLSWLACPHCSQPLHTDRNGADHCGGCALTWWEGVR